MMKKILLLLSFVSAFFLSQGQTSANAPNVVSKKMYSDTARVGYISQYFTDSAYFFGDSYTVGTGATQQSYRWTSLVAELLRVVEVNKGVGGTVLEKGTPLNPYGPSPNMVDNLPNVPVYQANRKWLFIAYGFNDMLYNGGTYDTTHYRSDYVNILDTITGPRGWPASHIVIVTPYNGTQLTYNSYATTTSNPAINRAWQANFITCAQNVAAQFGCLVANPANVTNYHDSTLLYYSDNIHPNNDGHKMIAQVVYAAIKDSVFWQTQALGINGQTSVNNLYYHNADTVGGNAQFAGIDSNGHVGTYPSNYPIHDALLTPQGSNISLIGKGLFGNFPNATQHGWYGDIENLLVGGGAKAQFLRAYGSLPSGMRDSSVEISMYTSTEGYIGAYNRTTSTALDMSWGGLGSRNVFGGLSFVGSNKYQFRNGYMSIADGYGLFIGVTTTTPSTSMLELNAQGAGSSIVPLILDSNVLASTLRKGAIEYNGNGGHFYGTINVSGTPTRYQLDQQASGATFTSTPTAGTNVSAVSVTGAFYSQAGGKYVVTIWGTLTTTTPATQSLVTFTLPSTATNGASVNVSGNLASALALVNATTTTTIQVAFTPTGSGAGIFSIQITYY